jgi:hypothetical protein
MKNSEKTFKKYYSRIAFEGIVKSFFLALVLGFGIAFVFSLVSWFFGYDAGLFLSIGLAVGITIIGTIIIYFAKFRPTTKDIARRVDRLGLEERLITMVEFEKDESYIAMRQREDAKRCMDEVNAERIKLALSRGVVILAIVTVLMGSGMTVAGGLAKEGIIPSGEELITGQDPAQKDMVTISYLIEEGGEIVGDGPQVEEQILEKGQDAYPVTAVAMDGWVFDGWSDGQTNPTRQDLNVQKNRQIYALFAFIEEGDGGDEPGEDGGASDGSDSESAGDEPGEGDSSDSSQGDMGENGENSSDKGEGESSDSGQGDDQEGDGGASDGAGGRWEDKNFIIDGKTYYGDELETYYEMAMDIIASGGELPEELKAFIEKYYDSI